MDEVVELEGGVEVCDVEKVVRNTGIRGLDTDAAKELGVFDRFAYLISLMHAGITASYSIYGDIVKMLNDMNSYRHEIRRVCERLDDEYARFFRFWRREEYLTVDAVKEMNYETEQLYHHLMRWAQLPEQWDAGDPQHREDSTDVIVKVEMDDKDLKFHRTVLSSEQLEEMAEEYCVTSFDRDTRTQTTVETGMDKSSALMSAKRLSANDPERMYTASVLQTFTEKRTEVCPLKVFKAGELIGRVGKVFKK